MGQAITTASAAASQDLAAVGGSHSLTETVLLGALKLLGLIGTRSCHSVTPPIKNTGAFFKSTLTRQRKTAAVIYIPRKTAYGILYKKGSFLSTTKYSVFLSVKPLFSKFSIC